MVFPLIHDQKCSQSRRGNLLGHQGLLQLRLRFAASLPSFPSRLDWLKEVSAVLGPCYMEPIGQTKGWPQYANIFL